MAIVRKLTLLALTVCLLGACCASSSFAALIVGALGKTNSLYTVSDSGTVTSLPLTGVAFTQQLAPVVYGGDVYVTNASSVLKISGSGVVTNYASGFSNAYGLAADSLGNLYVANQSGTTISKIATGGTVTTYGTGLSGPQGLAFDSLGNMWVTGSAGGIYKIAPGGGAATLAASTGTNLQAAAFDSLGNMYVGYGGSNLAKVTFSSPGVYGSINTTFASIANSRGVAIDSSDNIFAVSQNGFVQKFTTAGGTGTTFATGLTSNPWFVTVGTVPEPGTYALLAVGAGLLLLRRRQSHR